MNEAAVELSPMEAALNRAKEAVGGNTALAEKLGDLTPQAISQWKKVPPGRVIEVEKHTGVSRHELRPDIYPAAEEA